MASICSEDRLFQLPAAPLPQTAPRCSAAFRCGGGLGPAENGGPNPSGSVASSTARARWPGARPSAQRSGARYAAHSPFIETIWVVFREHSAHPQLRNRLDSTTTSLGQDRVASKLAPSVLSGSVVESATSLLLLCYWFYGVVSHFLFWPCLVFRD